MAKEINQKGKLLVLLRLLWERTDEAHGMTAAQSAYNQYAPILMTSVDTDPALCAAERKAVFARLTPGDWQIFGAHGAKKDVSVPDPT